MNQTIAISSKTIEEILTRLDRLTREVKTIKKRVSPQKATFYGSDSWWKKEIEEGLEEVKQGKVRGPFKNASELIKTLHQDTGR